jgi:protein involved in polysaccharide export with SLBB domain
MRALVIAAILAWSIAVVAAREPSHHFHGFYRGYLEQYAAAELPENAPERVAVIGFVKKPGVLEPRQGLTLMKAIEESGGFADFADHHHVGIWKDATGRFQIANTHAIERKEEQDPVLEKGDIVIVTVRWMTGI